MTSKDILLLTLLIVVAGFAGIGIVWLRGRIWNWLMEHGLGGLAFLIGVALIALLTTHARVPFLRWSFVGVLGLSGLGMLLYEHSDFVRERITVYHAYTIMIVLGLTISIGGWFIAAPGRWIAIALGVVIAGVPSVIWIWLWRARKRDARDLGVGG